MIHHLPVHVHARCEDFLYHASEYFFTQPTFQKHPCSTIVTSQQVIFMLSDARLKLDSMLLHVQNV